MAFLEIFSRDIFIILIDMYQIYTGRFKLGAELGVVNLKDKIDEIVSKFPIVLNVFSRNTKIKKIFKQEVSSR